MWDAFVSYASEDRARIALPLAKALQNNGLSIWFDEFQLNVGDSLSRKIDAGLARSKFGVVILSENFFLKEWPRKELDALISRERDGQQILLPVWHEIQIQGILKWSPILAGRYAAKTDEGLEIVVQKLCRAMGHVVSDESIGGLWAGRTGRMRLEQNGISVRGDYDWKSLEWVAHLEGEFRSDVFRFTWRWDRTEEKGPGYLVHSLDGRTLTGEWFYEDEDVDIEEALRSRKPLGRNAWSFIRVSSTSH